MENSETSQVPNGVAVMWYCVVDILSGDVLVQTRNVYKTAVHLTPGTTWAVSLTKETARQKAIESAASFKEGGYTPWNPN